MSSPLLVFKEMIYAKI